MLLARKTSSHFALASFEGQGDPTITVAAQYWSYTNFTQYKLFSLISPPWRGRDKVQGLSTYSNTKPHPCPLLKGEGSTGLIF
jgi:hypothetical protein